MHLLPAQPTVLRCTATRQEATNTPRLTVESPPSQPTVLRCTAARREISTDSLQHLPHPQPTVPSLHCGMAGGYCNTSNNGQTTYTGGQSNWAHQSQLLTPV